MSAARPLAPLRDAWRRRREVAPRLRLLAARLALRAAQFRPAAAGESIGPGVARFHASAAAREAARPTPALERPRPALGPPPADVRTVPRFGRALGRPAAAIDVEPGTSLHGAGATAHPLRLDGRAALLWNFDAWAFGPGSPQLYQSHPWVLAVRADGSAFGVLFDTVERAALDLSRGIRFLADGPPFPVIVIEGAGPAEVVAGLAELTGRMPMPPRWALGYHQCRYSYTPEARVREVAAELRRRRLPCDALWLDIDYMDGYRCFTFDPRAFPDPAGLNRDLHAQGFRTVWMIDPGIHRQPGYRVHDAGAEAGVWVQDAGGRDVVGRVWPGDCVFPDFTRAAVRAWWAGLHREFLDHGVDGVWNDMNEPSVFDRRSRTLPLSARHQADAELGGPGGHARYHNVYGMQMVRATREGMRAARPERRPFLLTRAGCVGVQRYAAAWTGDNTASWSHLDLSIAMTLNLGLSGQPFAGADIGGFLEDGDARLFARWMGIGALLPFARGHTDRATRDKEPWAFGPEVEALCRAALERRSRLLPYLYTVFREAHATGLPVARPLFFADPADPALRGEDDAFLLGADLLVIADPAPAPRRPALPRGDWRPLDCECGEAGFPDLPRLRLRAGAVLPLGPILQHDGASALDPLTLVAAPDAAGRAAGLLYEDDGDGYEHERGRFRQARYRFDLEGEGPALRRETLEGRLDSPPRRIVLRVLAPGGERRFEGAEDPGRDGPILVAPAAPGAAPLAAAGRG